MGKVGVVVVAASIIGGFVSTQRFACSLYHEAGRLKKVLVSPPLEKYDVLRDYNDLLVHDFIEMPDLKKACIQHQDFVEVLEDNGVEVEVVEPNPRFPNLCFVRDAAVITPHGAILSSYRLESRVGEEKIVASKLRELGIPVIGELSPPAYFEGASCIYFLGDRVIIGLSSQTNLEGVEYVSSIVRSQGIEDIRVIKDAGYHLDGIIGVVSRDTLVVVDSFKDHKLLRDFNLIPVPDETDELLATNILCLEEGKVIAWEGAKQAIKMMEKNKVDVTSVDISEFVKMGGGPHCLTLDLKREKLT